MSAPATSPRQQTEPRLWLFNLDAALELASPGPYQTSQRFFSTLEPVLAQAQKLLLPGDEVLSQGQPAQARWATYTGCAWSPTPSALRRLAEAGARLEPSPNVEVLRRVNHRRFYLELGGGAPGARYVENRAELAAALAEARTRPALFKRPYGFAGRGQRRIQGEPSADDQRWLDASLRRGGLLVEPWLEIALEIGVHALIDASGQVRFGRVCVQQTYAFRCWTATRVAQPDELEAHHEQALLARARSVAEALWRAGYFGPFGIDAYLWRTPSGAIELNPLGELNARYTMGFSVGMAERA